MKKFFKKLYKEYVELCKFIPLIIAYVWILDIVFEYLEKLAK